MKTSLTAFCFSVLTMVSGQAIVLTNASPTSTEDFNSLASTGTSSTVPADWAFAETGTSANTTYTAGTGSTATGDTYSFGASGSSERAFGTLRSGTLVPTIGAFFSNGGSSSIISLSIAYTGEEWRLGTAGRTDQLDFQYSLNATSLSDGTWTDVDSLDFVTPSTTTTGAKDGNAAPNRASLSSSITGLNVGAGNTLWIRWIDASTSGSQDGLAIDDFSITATFAPVPEPTTALFGCALVGLTVLHRRRRMHLA